MNGISIYGLVLAGGRSSRMGTDKGEMSYHDRPQREYAFELLKPYCERVFVSCRVDQSVPLQLNPLYDSFDLDSPLNGILSAFQSNPGIAWLTIPVDMPFIRKEDIEYLLAERDSSKNATCFYDSSGSLPEPLFTVWEPHAFTMLMEYFDGGGYSPRKFLVLNDAKILSIPDPRSLININSREDWLRLRERGV